MNSTRSFLGLLIFGTIAALLQEPLISAMPARQGSTPAPAIKKSNRKPKGSVRGTIEEAIRALEEYDCEAFAVDFLNPIKRAAIPNLESYKRERQCSPTDKGNLDEVLLVLRLSRLATPEYKGATAIISLEGVGVRIDKISLVRYIDGKWYFNEL